MNSRIIVAMDFPSVDDATSFAVQLDPTLCKLKVGKELFTRGGPQVVSTFVQMGFDVFLDMKYHDIPNTVAGACTAAADIGVWMMNVHALGGGDMMDAAVDALDEFPADQRPLLVAVTILTSMDERELHSVGLHGSIEKNVQHLAWSAAGSKCDGVVCSAHEAELLRETRGPEFTLVTPGIRLPDDNANDQSRIMTPAKAIKAGADYLVIGRTITQSDDPIRTLQNINDNIEAK